MKNIYEYIHYIQSLKSIWTKMMSTWGCYFCCVFLKKILNLFFIFVSLLPCEVCIISFLRKYWMYSKKRQETHADTRFSFSSEDFKNGNKIQKSFKEFSEVFFFLLFFLFVFSFTSRRRKRKLGVDTVEHTASTILVIQTVTKN